MSSRDEYIRKIQARLEEWNSEIDTLTAKAGEVTADVKNEYNKQIESLRVKQATARQKIEAPQQTRESPWEDLKLGFGLAWTSMGDAIDSARSHFR